MNWLMLLPGDDVVTAGILGLCCVLFAVTLLRQVRALRAHRRGLLHVRDAIRQSVEIPHARVAPAARPYLVPTPKGGVMVDGEGRPVLHTWPMPLLHPVEAPGRNMAGLFTALGILGTFIGLTTGLDGLDFTDTDTESMKKGVGVLVGGMSRAFLTSLYGISFGALSIILQALLQARMDAIRAGTFHQVQEETRLLLPGQTLAMMDPGATAAAAEAQVMAARELAGSLEHLKEFRAERIGEIVGAQVNDALKTSMVPAFEQMTTTLQDIRRLMADQNKDLMEELLRELRDDVIAPLADRVEASSRSTERAAEAVETLHRELGGIATQLAGSVEVLDRFQRDTLERLHAFQQGLATTLDAFRDETTQVLDRVGTQLTETVASAGDQAVRLIDGARENLDRSFQNIDHTMTRVRETVEEQLVRFRDEYQTSLESFFAQQNTLLEESLGAQRDGLHRVVEALDQAFREEYARRQELSEDLSQRLRDLSGAREDIEALLDAVGATQASAHGQLQEVALTLGKTLTGVEGRYRDLDERLSESMHRTHQQLADFLDQAQTTYTKAFQEFDAGAGRILSQLAVGAAEYLRVQRQVELTKRVDA